MNYIEHSSILPGWVVVAGGVAAVLFLGFGIIFTKRADREKTPRAKSTWNLIGISMIIPMAGSLVAAAGGGSPDRALLREQLSDEVHSAYGIDLTEVEARALDYPLEKPASDFEAFGSFERMLPDGDGGYELNRVFLIWEDGKMKLAKSTDGESFTPLKADR